MPQTTNTGWSTTTPDPTYMQSVYETFNRFREQLHAWGDQVNWNIPTTQPNSNYERASQMYMSGADTVNAAESRSNEYYDKANAQLQNVAGFAAPKVQLGEGVYDKMKPVMDEIFNRYALTDVEKLLDILGPAPIDQLGKIGVDYAIPQIGQIGTATGYSAEGATVSAIDPRRNVVRDIQGINSVDELAAYLDKIESGAFNQFQKTAEQELERQRQIQLQQVMSQAAAQNAFGGARHGVVEAETNRAALDAQAKLSADMAMRKLEFANSILQTDIGRRMSAQQLNQAADMAVELEKARLGTQANIATGQNVTQANIASASNLTNASIANADAKTRAAIAQAQLENNLQQALINARGGLLGQHLISRANIINNSENVKPNMIRAMTDPLTTLSTTQYNAEVEAAIKNAMLEDTWQDRQRGIGQDYGKLAESAAVAGATTAGAKEKLGEGFKDLGKELTELEQQNNMLQWYGGFMNNMWQPSLTAMELATLLSLPYATKTEGESTTNRPTTIWDVLGVLAQIGGITAVAASDPNLKKDVKEVSGGSLDRISKLRPVEYSVKNDKKKERLRGLLATEVGKASPEYEAEIGAYNAVNLEPIIADIVGAIQELADKGRKKR